MTWSLSIIILLAAIAGATFGAYQWTQTRYFVGESNGVVAIYQGVPESVGPFGLSSVFEESVIDLESLLPFEQERVNAAIPAESLEEARNILERLRKE